MPGSGRIQPLCRRAPILFTLIVACALLVACGSGQDDNPSVSEAPEATDTVVPEPTALSGVPRIGPAIWTSAIDPVTAAPLGTLPPSVADTFIYAVFPVESLPAGSQLVATWFFNDTSLDSLGSALRIDRDRVSGWVEFHIERTGADPWPDGVYEIVVSDGTNEIQRAEIAFS